MDAGKGTVGAQLDQQTDESRGGAKAGELAQVAEGRDGFGEAQSAARLIIPHVRDRGFKSSPRNQLPANSLSACRGPDFPGLFYGGDKMVTNARKFCAIIRLWALFAEITIPLSLTHTWRFSSPSGCPVYFGPFSKVVTSAHSLNPRGAFRAIAQRTSP